MTDDAANEIFAGIMGAEDNADLAEVQAPEGDARKDGVYYAADEDAVSTYHVVVDHRVVAHVLVDAETQVERPDFLSYSGLHEGTTFHSIVIATPDRKAVILTKGLTIKAPGGIYNRSLLRAYLTPRMARMLVRLYGLGA